MFEAANIREWRGHDVVDAQGRKIGALEAVYVDTGTDLPSFGTVKVGLVRQPPIVPNGGCRTKPPSYRP